MVLFDKPKPLLIFGDRASGERFIMWRQLAIPFSTLVLIFISTISCAANTASTPIAVPATSDITATALPISGTTAIPTKLAATATPIPTPDTPVPPPTDIPATFTPAASPTPHAEQPPVLVTGARAAMLHAPSHRIRGWYSSPLFSTTPTPTTDQLVKGAPIMESETDGTNTHFRFGTSEDITIGSVTYHRENPEAQWIKATTTPTAASNGADFLKDFDNPSGARLEIYDSTLCQVISADVANAQTKTSDHYVVWIGLVDHLVRRYELQNKVVHAVVEFYDYGAPVVIQAPTTVSP